MLTSAERRRILDAMVEELVEQGIPRAEATTHVRETALHEFDVIIDTPTRRRPAPRPASAAR